MTTWVLILCVFTALCFTTWPFLMKQSGLHYLTAAFMLNAVSAAVFLPAFLSRGIHGGFPVKAALLLGLSAGLLNGLGHYFFQQVIASKTEASRFIVVLLVIQVVVAMTIPFVIRAYAPDALTAETISLRKIGGAILAIGAIVLLAAK